MAVLYFSKYVHYSFRTSLFLLVYHAHGLVADVLVALQNVARVGVYDIDTAVEVIFLWLVERYVGDEVVATEHEVGDYGLVAAEGLQYVGLVERLLRGVVPPHEAVALAKEQGVEGLVGHTGSVLGDNVRADASHGGAAVVVEDVRAVFVVIDPEARVENGLARHDGVLGEDEDFAALGAGLLVSEVNEHHLHDVVAVEVVFRSLTLVAQQVVFVAAVVGAVTAVNLAKSPDGLVPE